MFILIVCVHWALLKLFERVGLAELKLFSINLENVMNFPLESFHTLVNLCAEVHTENYFIWNIYSDSSLCEKHRSQFKEWRIAEAQHYFLQID